MNITLILSAALSLLLYIFYSFLFKAFFFLFTSGGNKYLVRVGMLLHVEDKLLLKSFYYFNHYDCCIQCHTYH